VAIEGDLISVKAEGIRMPNGIRWSPDEKVMYFVDSWPGQVWSYEFNVNDGVLGKRRLFLDYEGSGVKPDGCVVDEEGCLWIAEVNRSRVARYSPSGKLDSEVLVPTGKPTSVSFLMRSLPRSLRRGRCLPPGYPRQACRSNFSAGLQCAEEAQINS
jgi:sugar lactone lactonase YvrE